MAKDDAKARRKAALKTPSDLSNAAQDIAGALNACLADTFALYFKTKNFHWHVSGPHFRDYHLLLDEQAAELLAATDDMAERVRKVGATTLRSIGHVGRLQRLLDNDADFVRPTTCWRSCARTTGRWSRACARRTGSATRPGTWRPRA